ncbi:methyltransferase domain-containing protein [Vreelandella nanhaiensis]|nr:methyltransferase domain-containing protein [Halomonas nanhaiensis]
MSKHTDVVAINSDRYWDKRFAENWDKMGGPQQSRFFARLALENLPKWILREIHRDKLTVADWGCAEGDGTDVLSESIAKSQLFGRDISQVAIDTASVRYEGISFEAADWLASEKEKAGSFDVVFSSNTLEHFHAPEEVLKKLALQARKAIVLLLPYKELLRADEHFSSFTPGNILGSINSNFSLVYSKVLDCTEVPESQWLGQQILLIYVDNEWFSSLSLVLEDMHIDTEDTEKNLKAMEKGLFDKTKEIKQLREEIEVITINHEQQLEELSKEIEAFVVNQKSQLDQIDRAKERIIALECINSELLQSNSWRMTAPLRYIRNACYNKKKTSYSILKSIYWHLPLFARQALQKPRHAIVRRFRTGTNLSSDSISNIVDLSWGQFNETVLINRDSYKGVFIQEFSIDWNVPLYQRPQHISAAMARLGYLVIYRTGNWSGDNVNGFREVAENVWVTNCVEVDEIRNAVRSIYSTAYALTVDYVSKFKDSSVLVYEYIDHIDPEISGDKKNVQLLLNVKKFAFDGGVDYIVASANQLYDEAVEALGKKRVLLAQNGVDTRHYRNSEHNQVALPVELEEFCNRYEHVIGYFGALAPWLWYDVIDELTQKRKDIGFVFIGPDYYGGSAKLAKGNNILYLGSVDYKILPAYGKKFDVCFIPFKPGDIAQTTSPLKLFEYFALEKPVVVTSYMRECVQYPEVFRGSNVEELSNALDAAIAVKDDQAFKQSLAKLADENDWDQRAKVIARCFDDL